jgi:serine phosphatase RsbU (regulator of sigma subunit)
VGLGVAVLVFGWVILTFRHRAFLADSVPASFFAALVTPVLHHGLVAALFFGAGTVALRTACPWPTEGLERLLRGEWRARSLWTGVRAGLLGGLGLALVPYGVAAILPGFLPFGLVEEVLASRWPATAALWPRLSLVLLGWLLVIEPLCVHIFRYRFLARPVAVVAGAFLLAGEVDAAATVPELLVAGAIAALLLDILFHRWGVLAAVTAASMASGATGAAVLALQPGAFRVSGMLALGTLVALGAVVARVAARGDTTPLSVRDLEVPRRLRAERERIKAQLSVAREAQMRMLPAAPPQIPGFELAASCQPAKEVGGDLYDFIPLAVEDAGGNGEGGVPSRSLGIALGDVSGKGMVASLYMTLTKGLLLAAAERTTDPCAMLADVNRGLYQESERNIFVTLWYGVLDPATRSLRHVRAGHNPALWRRSERTETVALRPPGFALGGTSSKLFNRLLKEEQIQLESGDGLFIYSDGLTEAMNDQMEEYGDDRLEAAIARTDGLSADRALNAILADVHAFIGDAPQHDDMTLVVLRVA